MLLHQGHENGGNTLLCFCIITQQSLQSFLLSKHPISELFAMFWSTKKPSEIARS